MSLTLLLSGGSSRPCDSSRNLMAHLPHRLRRSPLPRASLLPLPLAPLPQHRHLPLIMRQPLRLVAVPRPHHPGWRLFPLSISLTLLIAPNTLVLLSQLRAHSNTLLRDVGGAGDSSSAAGSSDPSPTSSESS